MRIPTENSLRWLNPQKELRQARYLNNTIEQDHRRTKRLVTPGLGFGAFHPALKPLKGYKAMLRTEKFVALTSMTDRTGLFNSWAIRSRHLTMQQGGMILVPSFLFATEPT